MNRLRQILTAACLVGASLALGSGCRTQIVVGIAAPATVEETDTPNSGDKSITVSPHLSIPLSVL